ncbi:hypothetical protein Ddc_14839 [Ditylenchus destructor]|nr:hypothetical protein Ddc_14839 [Ditylenchus destructor]
MIKSIKRKTDACRTNGYGFAIVAVILKCAPSQSVLVSTYESHDEMRSRIKSRNLFATSCSYAKKSIIMTWLKKIRESLGYGVSSQETNSKYSSSGLSLNQKVTVNKVTADDQEMQSDNRLSSNTVCIRQPNGVFLSFDDSTDPSYQVSTPSNELSPENQPLFSLSMDVCNNGLIFRPATALTPVNEFSHCAPRISKYCLQTPNQSPSTYASTPIKQRGIHQPMLITDSAQQQLAKFSPILNAPTTSGIADYQAPTAVKTCDRYVDKSQKVLQNIMRNRTPGMKDLFDIEDSDDDSDYTGDPLDSSSHILPDTSQASETEHDVDELCVRTQKLLSAWINLHNTLLQGVGMDAIRPQTPQESLPINQWGSRSDIKSGKSLKYSKIE